MSENVDTLKAGYEAFARGDLDGAMKDFDDGIRWENPNAPALPNPGVHEGKEKVRELLASTPQYWDEFRLTPDEFVDGGDTVVVLGHLEARGKETGKDVKSPFVHVWRMSGGTVQRVQLLSDTALVVEALGR
jgi:ketosteroid isomerase-like protein